MNSRKSSTGGQARAKTEGTPEGVRDGPSDSPSASDNLLRSQSRQIHRKPLSASSPIRCESIDRKNYRSPEKTKKGSSGTNSSRADTFELGNVSSCISTDRSINNDSMYYEAKSYFSSSFSDDSEYILSEPATNPKINFSNDNSSDVDDMVIKFSNCSVDSPSNSKSNSTSTSHSGKNNLKVSNHIAKSPSCIDNNYHRTDYDNGRGGSATTTDDSYIDFESAPVSSFIFIDKTLTRLEYDTWKKKIKSWKTYEQVIAQTYKSGLSYIYLFLDPLVTNDLPNRADQFKSVNRIEIWNTFIKSIFYIGKGTVGNKKGTDTYCRYTKHLTKASVIGPYNKSEKKIEKIRNIWDAGKGVICVQAFHNVESKDALIREATMIEAIGLGHKVTENQRKSSLTNKIGGQQSKTVIQNWDMSDKKKLGCHLLYRAMCVYLYDGERQLKRSMFLK